MIEIIWEYVFASGLGFSYSKNNKGGGKVFKANWLPIHYVILLQFYHCLADFQTAMDQNGKMNQIYKIVFFTVYMCCGFVLLFLLAKKQSGGFLLTGFSYGSLIKSQWRGYLRASEMTH